MTVSGMISKFETLTPEKIRELSIGAVLENSDTVLSDAIVSNAEGLTFAGNKIAMIAPFSDWEESGEFHDNLNFESTKDIIFTSRGDGASAVFSAFPYEDTIAPTAKILGESTKADIQQSLVNAIKNI